MESQSFGTGLSPQAHSTAAAAMGVPKSSMHCHTPFCSFLVHPDVQFGGFCCCKCYWRFKSSANCKRKHGENCKGEWARPTAQAALYAAPVWYQTECLATHSQPASSSGTRYLGATSFLGQRQAVHDGGHPLAESVPSDPIERVEFETKNKGAPPPTTTPCDPWLQPVLPRIQPKRS